MPTVIVSCSECKSQKGTLQNLWIQIGEDHISPAVQTSHFCGIRPEGPSHPGEKGTVLDGFRVQKMVCQKCLLFLGFKCLDSVPNHVLHAGQLVLPISSIQVKCASGSFLVGPSIQGMLMMNLPTIKPQTKDHGSRSRDGQATNQTQASGPILHSIGTQTEATGRLITASHHTVTSFNEDVRRINDEVRKLKNDMARMTNGPSDTNSKIKSLADDVLSVKAAIKETRRELQPLVAPGDLEQESTSIRNTIAEVDTSLRVEYNGRWEELQQRLDLLESRLKNTQRDLKGNQAAAASALAASDANTEEIIGLKGRVQRTERQVTVQREPITRPQRRESQIPQLVGSKRKAAPNDYAEGNIDSNTSPSTARSIGNNLLAPPPAKAPRNAASADTPKFIKLRGPK